MHAAREEVWRIARGELKLERPWKQAMLGPQREIRRAYLDQAVALERADDPQSRALAARVRGFVGRMSPVLVRRNEWVGVARGEQK